MLASSTLLATHMKERDLGMVDGLGSKPDQLIRHNILADRPNELFSESQSERGETAICGPSVSVS